ncbi:MAG: hypothetical protein WAN81_08590 [Candidatus Binataceae bacterium]
MHNNRIANQGDDANARPRSPGLDFFQHDHRDPVVFFLILGKKRHFFGLVVEEPLALNAGRDGRDR